MKTTVGCVLVALASFLSASGGEKIRNPHQFLGPYFSWSKGQHQGGKLGGKQRGTDAVSRWNQIAIDASGLDHTPPADGEDRVYGEQLGPCRASRAMAIVHVAMFEVMNALGGSRYSSYLSLPRGSAGGSVDAAVAQAARDTLVSLFPSQKASFDEILNDDLAKVTNSNSKTKGVALGKSAAATILALRANDHSNHDEPRMDVDYHPANAPGQWRQDPIAQGPIALGARWGAVTPFLLASGSQFRLPPPPALNSLEYALAYVEAKRLGGDGITTVTERTDEEKFIGIFWAYDGTPSLCAPPRLYNQLASTIAGKMGTHGLELARLLALINVAMADAGIAAWDSKYHYCFWRPVTAIRESDPGTGPSTLGDGNVDTVGDAQFWPLGAPASNLQGPNFTPPFPAYPSGHATFGGALFQTLRRFYGRDDIAFTFVSDEYNGSTTDNTGAVRPVHPRSFKSLSEAELENAESRIYLGIHWRFDATSGIEMGRNVGDYVVDRLYRARN